MHILLNSLYLKFGIFYMPSEKPNINKNRKCNIFINLSLVYYTMLLAWLHSTKWNGDWWRMAWKSFEVLVAWLRYCNIWSVYLTCSRW